VSRVLVTGAAGFIGFHLAKRLLTDGHEVVGLDIVNDYYDPKIKWGRLDILKAFDKFSFVRLNLADRPAIMSLFETQSFDVVVNLAAQAGVRHSLSHPWEYVDSNVHGFLNILEGCRAAKIKHLLYASSSSVYGANAALPFSAHDPVNHPLSIYAATKKANEMMAHAYSDLYDIPTTGLRFFTVYGPWGRPDMAMFLFASAIIDGRPIKVFNNGDMRRDFTYVDDVVEGIVRLMSHPPTPNPDWNPQKPDPATSRAPFKIYNIGNNNPVELMDLIKAVEKRLGREAEKTFLPMQPGDVKETSADVTDLIEDVGYCPSTSVTDGVNRFIDWYASYYDVSLPLDKA
jgi:UDP-glucuronate 4-epimerase